MPDPSQITESKSNWLNAWFVRLDNKDRSWLSSGRLRILSLSLILLTLILIELIVPLNPDNQFAKSLNNYSRWIDGISLITLLLLLWSIWRELLQPLLRLCQWADLMRGVNLDARVCLNQDSDFTELANDINMLGNMINQLSRDTEVQLQKHTDYISRESRSLAILYDVATSINTSRDLNELFEKSLESLRTHLDCSAGIIRQLQGSNKQELVASFGELNHTFLSSADHFLPLQDPSDNKIHRTDTLTRATVFGGDVENAQQNIVALSVLVRYRNETLGVIHLFFPDNNDLNLENYNDLLLSIGQHLGSAVEKFRLLEEENQLLIIQERAHISHELHDSLAQTMASLRIQLRLVDETIQSNDTQSTKHQLERIEFTIEQANNQLRELIAYFGVPMNKQGLISSIEDSISRTEDETGMSIYFQNEWPGQDIPSEIELNVLRIVQECLANIRKHSQAKKVRVLLSRRDCDNRLLIEDDGIGFDESSIKPEWGQRLGLNILRDRAKQINGNITIESEPDEGTRINLRFKLEDQH